MAAKLVDNLRRGQAELTNQLLAEQLTLSGLVSSTAIAAALETCGPGELGARLVDNGALSPSQLDTLATAAEFQSALATVAGGDAPAEVEAVSQNIDRRLGRYVLVDEIGAGGMGVVWRGWDAQLSRWVAIKLVKVRDSQLVRRFMQEAKLLAKLAHPNITQVFEVGVHEGRPYLAMELVNGKPPSGTEPLERSAAAAIVRDAARAVHYAHEQGIVHRDLKPSNLLVDDRGRVFVTDFGLARMREEASGMTQSGALLGTPSFMAPEQAQGKEADYRTDVYGLGATLYALVAGEPPHSGEIVHEIVKRVAISNPPTLTGNDDLVVVAQKAMERDREDRYQDAAELADDLQRFVDDEPVQAKAISTVERAWRRARRRPVYSSLVATGTLVLASVLIGGGTFIWNYFERQAEIAAATDSIASADGVMTEIRRMYANDDYNADWERAALGNLERYVTTALDEAPGYGPALYQQGMLHLWRDEEAAAIDAFNAALDADPNHHEARAARAGLLLATNDAASTEAIADVDGFSFVAPPMTAELEVFLDEIAQEVDRLPPELSRRQLVSAMLAGSRGEFEDGAAQLSSYLADHPYDLQARSQLMWHLLALERFGEAAAVADLLIERNRMPALSQYGKAFAYAGLDDIDSAIDAMRQSNSVSPDPDAQQWIGFWLAQQGDFEQAIETYTEVLRDEPDHFTSLTGRASALTIIGLPDLARADAERAVALQPDNAYAHFLLAGALLTSEPARAIEEYATAENLDAGYADDTVKMRALAEINLGELDAAAVTLERALDIVPSDLQSRDLLARVHLMREDVPAVREVLNRGEKYADDYVLLAQAERFAGNALAARQALEAAVGLAPDNAIILSELAYQYLADGNRALASETFAQAHALAPEEQTVYRNEAYAWAYVGDTDAALGVVERWLGEHPGSADALEMQAWLREQGSLTP
ncbi:MAG: protein kinase [Pseudomonadota bacterium]